MSVQVKEFRESYEQYKHLFFLPCRRPLVSQRLWSSLSSRNSWMEKTPTNALSKLFFTDKINSEKMTRKGAKQPNICFTQVQKNGHRLKEIYHPPQRQCAHALPQTLCKLQWRQNYKGTVTYDSIKSRKIIRLYERTQVSLIGYKSAIFFWSSGCEVSRVPGLAALHVSDPRGVPGLWAVCCARPLWIQLSCWTLLLLY